LLADCKQEFGLVSTKDVRFNFVIGFGFDFGHFWLWMKWNKLE
jgi:hypothetical protein